MKQKYSMLLSPIEVGGHVLKNRMVSSNSLPHFLMGPEPYPSQQVINHLSGVAKNGASIVTFADYNDPNQRNAFNEDGRRFPMFDFNDPSLDNYLCQLSDQVHYFNSLISICLMPFLSPIPGYEINASQVEEKQADSVNMFFSDEVGVGGADFILNAGMNAQSFKELDRDQIHEIIQIYADRCAYYQKMGFDMCTLHFAYRLTLFARFLSPATNHRTDEYGGSVHNRCRFMRELCTAIKERCGKSFLIEIEISGDESEYGGYGIDEFIQIGKEVEDVVDIFQIRHGSANGNHPTGFNSTEHEYPTVAPAAAMKQAGVNILAEVIGGYQDPEDSERLLQEGKVDLIAAARAFFCDPNSYDKMLDNRAEDIVPCIRCNKCHVPSLEGNWNSCCSINPKLGISHVLDHLSKPIGAPKRIAVIGGGPAGMQSALYCKERGHQVTLYEKQSKLGGQLYHSDYASFKWPVRRYRDYLIFQLQKQGIDVRMNTEATPEMIESENYDAVILALGATPKVPQIVGGDTIPWNTLNVFGRESELGHRVVVVGGSECGVETALYLCENGHDVTILSRKKSLAHDATPIHYRETIVEKWAEYPDTFHSITNVSTTELAKDHVTYVDEQGESHTISCDDVVPLGGMRPHHKEAMEFWGTAPRVIQVGDCYKVGNIRTCNRTAYAAASQL